MEGWFELKTVYDLLRKLERDFEKLRNRPHDVDLAFNFFITAEHLLDWYYPGRDNEHLRRREREQDLLLQVTSHLANGAKHFKAEAKHHKSVKDAARGGGLWPKELWPEELWPSDFWGGNNLYIELNEEEAKELGSRIVVVKFAERVLRRWQEKLQVP